MTAKELRDKLARLRKERKEIFAKMTDGYKPEDVTAYEEKAKEIHDCEYALTEAERIELDDRTGPEAERSVMDEERQSITDEEQRFLNSLRDAVAVGSTYTGLVPSTIASEIVKLRESYGKLRGRCRRMTLAGDYTIAVDGDEVTATYVSEGGKISDSTPSLGTVNFTAYKLAALVKVSEEFMADIAVDAISWLTEKIARAFSKKEDLEILKGSGSGDNHLTGILTVITEDAVTTDSATAITLDEVKELIEELGEYDDGAVLIMHPATRAKLSMLKDTIGQYYFPPQEKLTEIEGLEIITVSSMDRIGAGKRAIIAANLNFYQIVDRQGLNLTVLNELYAETGQKGIRATERLDGKPLVPAAFKVLALAASSNPAPPAGEGNDGDDEGEEE